MHIRLATREDIPQILALYDEAHEVMRRSGNPTQWPADYPNLEIVEWDMAQDGLYVCEDDEGVLAVLFFAPGPDPTYTRIEGAWLNDEPYWVVHRIASHAGTGAGTFCLTWACTQAHNVRLDTHEHNAPMRHVLAKLGFRACGTIICENGTPRMAYHRVC